VLDAVCVVWASLLEESLKVVCRRSRLVLAATYSGPDTRYTRAACFLIVATVTIGHDYDPLETLLSSLLATPGALFGVLDGDVGRHPPAADWGCLLASGGKVKFSGLVAGGIWGGGVA
jgi:hypothetical protein